MVAKRKGVSVSEVHRTASEQFLDEEYESTPKSRWADMVGMVDGPTMSSKDLGKQYAKEMFIKYSRPAR